MSRLKKSLILLVVGLATALFIGATIVDAQEEMLAGA